MEQQKVDMFLMTNGEFLPEHKIPFVREKLLTLDESKWGTLSTIQFKNPTTALLLSIFLGGWSCGNYFKYSIELAFDFRNRNFSADGSRRSCPCNFTFALS